MKEQFEKLDAVKGILSDHSDEVAFNESKNEYEAPMYENWIPEYIYELNFGWRVFQEMHKKIDSVIRLLDEKSMYHKTSGDRFVFSKDVGELLK